MAFNKYFTVILFLITQPVYAQQQSISTTDSTSGMIVYHQRIAIRELALTSDTLKFNRTKSIFTWHLYNNKNSLPSKIKQKYPGAQLPKNISHHRSQQINYTNFKQDSLFSRKDMRLISKILYVEEKIPEISWDIIDTTKKIGNYTVRKATTHFRGRDYTAWFTPRIPVPFGPWKLHGLPGLILQTYDQTGDIYFTVKKIVLKPVGAIQLNSKDNMPYEEETVGLHGYQEIMNHFKKYEKQKSVKGLRSAIQKGYMDESALDEMTFHFPEIHFMETFEDNNDQ